MHSTPSNIPRRSELSALTASLATQHGTSHQHWIATAAFAGSDGAVVNSWKASHSGITHSLIGVTLCISLLRASVAEGEEEEEWPPWLSTYGGIEAGVLASIGIGIGIGIADIHACDFSSNEAMFCLQYGRKPRPELTVEGAYGFWIDVRILFAKSVAVAGGGTETGSSNR